MFVLTFYRCAKLIIFFVSIVRMLGYGYLFNSIYDNV